MNIILIGMRGSGKSTIAALLARQRNLRAIDMDQNVLARLDQPSVTAAFAAVGEEAWRRAEREVLDELLTRDDQVIATGGGVVTIKASRDAIDRAAQQGQAIVVYLACSTAVLGERLCSEISDRPSLTGADPIDEIESVLDQREQWYRSLASIEMDVSDLDPPGVVAALDSRLPPVRR